MFDKFFDYFDKLEDKIRFSLSRHPLLYAFVGGVGIVLFWKGVWETAAYFSVLDGPMSILISIIILLAIGLFTSFFIGDNILISGIKEEKKMIEKTKKEIIEEETEITKVKLAISNIEKDVQEIKNILNTTNKKGKK